VAGFVCQYEMARTRRVAGAYLGGSGLADQRTVTRADWVAWKTDCAGASAKAEESVLSYRRPDFRATQGQWKLMQRD